MSFAPSHISFLVLILMVFIPFIKMAGLMIPLYMDPNSDWDLVVSIQKIYPALPIVAIINPNSGPGTAQDPLYVAGIKKLLDVGVTVVGYDHTSSAARSIADVKTDIDSYVSFYPNIQGIFFDEMQADASGDESYYQTASDYAKSKGFTMTIGNPGTKTPLSYMPTVDYVVISENIVTADLKDYGEYSAYYSHLVMMVINQATIPTAWVEKAKGMIGWIYVTSYTLPDPYHTLPSYMSTLAGQLANANTEKKSKKLAIILGAVLGTLGLIVIAGLITFMIVHWRKKSAKSATKVTTMSKPSDTTTQNHLDSTLKQVPDSSDMRNLNNGAAVVDISPKKKGMA